MSNNWYPIYRLWCLTLLGLGLVSGVFLTLFVQILASHL